LSLSSDIGLGSVSVIFLVSGVSDLIIFGANLGGQISFLKKKVYKTIFLY